MQKTATKAKSSSSYSRPTLQKSTTLSRKYVKKPGAAKAASSPKKVKIEEIKAAAIKEAEAALKSAEKKSAEKKVAVKEVKKAPEVAFKTKAKAADLSKAISASAKKAPIKAKKVERAKTISRFGKKAEVKKADKKTADAARKAMRGLATMETVKPMKKKRGMRFALAFGCAAVVVAALGVFVAINMPNISVKVAALQTGIDAAYPNFVPRNYSMETVASDKSGKVTMKFVGPNNASFVLTEEKSTWDSTAVLNNYVKTTYSANYSTMHEQGVTYYTESGSAVWVNGGILYKITSYGKNLTREQIRNLVVSL